jgi:hypothetical protein
MSKIIDDRRLLSGGEMEIPRILAADGVGQHGPDSPAIAVVNMEPVG